MRRVLSETWIPAVVFATVTAVGWVALTRRPLKAETWAGAAVAAGIAAAVTPPAWWLVATRRGRLGPGTGAAAGGICGAAVGTGLTLWGVVSSALRNDPMLGYALPYFAVFAVIAAPVGAGALGVAGALVGVALRRAARPRPGGHARPGPPGAPGTGSRLP